LNFLQNRPDAEAFLQPVDWKGLNLPDYPQIIKDPMDLGTIENNINRGVYKNAHEYARDVRLVWSNAKLYNQEGSGIYVVAVALEKMFEQRFAKIKKAEVNQTKSTAEDRLKFTELVKQLTSDQLGVVVEMIEKQCPAALNEGDQDDLEIEVYQIDGNTLKELISFANTSINKAKK